MGIWEMDFGGNFRVGPVRIRPFEFGKPEPADVGVGPGGPFAWNYLEMGNWKRLQMPKEFQMNFLEFIDKNCTSGNETRSFGLCGIDCCFGSFCMVVFVFVTCFARLRIGLCFAWKFLRIRNICFAQINLPCRGYGNALPFVLDYSHKTSEFIYTPVL